VSGPLAWFRQIALTLGACFFLLFGVLVLISAFGMEDPLGFILTFFSSTLMILISAAILAGLLWRMISLRSTAGNPQEGGDNGNDHEDPTPAAGQETHEDEEGKEHDPPAPGQ
jgi:hypothetical protein